MKKSPDHCIFFLLDGFRPDVLREQMDRGILPNLKEMFLDQGTFWDGTTVFPSTTGPAYLPMVTGCYPGTCNVPGIRWVDREHFENGTWSKKGTRSYVGPESFFFNQDLSPDIRSIFDVFPNHLSIHNLANKGVSKSAEPWKMFSTLLIFAAKLSHQWGMVDSLASSLARKILKSKDITFSFISFLGVDESAHLSSPFSKQTIHSYVEIDKAIGKIRKTLADKKILDRTIFFACADHGLSETKKHFELCDFVEKMGFKTFVYPKVYTKNNDAACMVSGNSMAHLYFKNDQWKNRMFHEDLVKRKMIKPFLEQEAVDVLISKTSTNSVIISSRRGEAEISKENNQLLYKVNSKDPLGYSENINSKNDYFDSTLSSNYPDAILQAWQIMQSSRAGDLIVTASLGHDLRDRFEIPEHFASHGSLHKEHMLVPILSSQKIQTNIPKRTVNLFPTMLESMGIDIKNLNIDGESFLKSDSEY